MKHKELNKENITKLLIDIQNNADWAVKLMASDAIAEFGLKEEYQKQIDDYYEQPR